MATIFCDFYRDDDLLYQNDDSGVDRLTLEVGGISSFKRFADIGKLRRWRFLPPGDVQVGCCHVCCATICSAAVADDILSQTALTERERTSRY